MSLLIGLVVIVVGVFGGYLMHEGKLEVLWQPTELMIIGGAATGGFIIGNPLDVIKDLGSKLKNLFKRKPYNKAQYLELLSFLFHVFKVMKTKGMLIIESHIENPHESELFKKYPSVLENHHVTDFLCDSLRLLVMGVDNHFQMEELIEKELEVHHHSSHSAIHALTIVGDGLPAFGIVAAVLGVINTMKSINQPPAILGAMIAGALVGTFLGVLLAYGIVSPISSYLASYDDAESKYMQCIKAGLISHMQGNAPAVTAEFVRKLISPHERPTFAELEEAMNAVKV